MLKSSRRTVSRSLWMGLIWITVWAPLAYGNPGDGYAVITTRDTILGVHGCYPQCAVDADCAERQRCVNVEEVGSVCLALREMEAAPDDWSLCEEGVGCAPTTLCARQRGPNTVEAFLAHKRARGFEVHLVDETVWGGGVGDAGADNIRAWLQANHVQLNLRYVLLLGDPRPDGDVPMRGTRPAHNAYQDWAGDPSVLTDFYFAELDGNWDLDGDGLLGEFSVNPAQIEPGSPASRHPESLTDDMGPGGANRDAELAVGRIPFYGDVDALDHILQKTMDYENAPAESIGWRRSALLAAEGQHRAFFGELIRTDILEPNGYPSYRVYDVHACWDEMRNEDDGCVSPIAGVPDTLHCNAANVEAGINALRPGFVSWLTHGSGRGAAAVMQPGNVMSLPDDRPFFTFQASCYNSQPTTPQNLSYELLKNGAIATIGATTISHGPGSPMPSLNNDAGNAGMAYNYARRLLVDDMSAGEALNSLRRDVGVSNRWWYWKNYLTFNLWGDPSIGINSHAIPEEMMDADAGVPPLDPDMGMPEMDAGVPMTDAGGMDAGGLDAGAPVDAEPAEQDQGPRADATVADAGTQVDMADPPSLDPDAGASPTEMDAGPSRRAERSDSGGCTTSPDSEHTWPVSSVVLLGVCLGVIRRKRQLR